MMVSRERPILFNEFSMRAFLAERKRQTRRTRSLDEVNGDPDAWRLQDLSVDPVLMGEDGEPFVMEGLIATFENVRVGDWFVNVRCPYGQSGDVLYGRETVRAEELPNGLDGVRYRVDNAFIPIDDSPEDGDRWSKLYHYDCKRRGRGAWVPGIHAPRWASRLDCGLLSVGMERVQDITEEDAVAEGVSSLPVHQGGAVHAYGTLWDAINFDRGLGWERNPWHWVLELDPVLRR